MTALRLRVTPVSTFTKPVRTLDPARGSSWYARVELQLGVVDAHPYTPFPGRHRCLGIRHDRAHE